MSKYRTNRVRQAPCGTWYFKFKFGGENYCKSHFDTQEQANEALQLQYKSLNLTTTGEKRGESKTKTKHARTPRKEIFIECNISLMYNYKYKVTLTTPKRSKTLDTLEQARAYRDEHKKKREKTFNQSIKKRTTKPAIVSSFADKTEREKQAVIRKNSLNKAIAELNNATRTIAKATTPTISELLRLAKQQINPRQYYINQLKAGAYRG